MKYLNGREWGENGEPTYLTLANTRALHEPSSSKGRGEEERGFNTSTLWRGKERKKGS